MAVARFGLKSLLPPPVKLVSGPGCPVCVTDQADMDAFLALGHLPRAILATFGDMVRVPGSTTSLERSRARDVQVRVVYSPLDAVALAREIPGDQVVFFGVGFETTMPATAVAIKIGGGRRAGAIFRSVPSTRPCPRHSRSFWAAAKCGFPGLLLPGACHHGHRAGSLRFHPGGIRASPAR